MSADNPSRARKEIDRVIKEEDELKESKERPNLTEAEKEIDKKLKSGSK